MAGVWVLAEQRSMLLELVGEGRRLADSLGGAVTALVVDSRELAQDALAYGADGAVLLSLPEGQPLETAAGVLADLARQVEPDLILLGSTLRVKDLAARLAALLDVGLATDAASLRLEGGALVVERMVYGGGGVSTLALTSRPAMATVPGRSFPEPVRDPRIGEIREVAVPADGRVRVVARQARVAEGVDIAEAQTVVGVGRGLASQADLAMIDQLAALLNGAVGCTRPVAEDLGWLPEDRYIGISGRKVAPALYIGIAASGQVQHVAGIKDARLVVAINKDENAPLFKYADYGLVGDAYQVVPALTAELKKLLG
ncbi:MAG: electron transfer flavoprotein subunit alpha/FixB family protein [Bacillota bacterium]